MCPNCSSSLTAPEGMDVNPVRFPGFWSKPTGTEVPDSWFWATETGTLDNTDLFRCVPSPVIGFLRKLLFCFNSRIAENQSATQLLLKNVERTNPSTNKHIAEKQATNKHAYTLTIQQREKD
jgi:hypothetical protein